MDVSPPLIGRTRTWTVIYRCWTALISNTMPNTIRANVDGSSQGNPGKAMGIRVISRIAVLPAETKEVYVGGLDMATNYMRLRLGQLLGDSIGVMESRHERPQCNHLYMAWS
ncbi:hypothetical protein FRX31_031651 [Thalictrum thalictroides]|uniref:Uncharacterized protein n=1 Tax=Thalictrum thalictroides TaxID=46969 RepID=A0A7J6V1B9_THATH|nr:hypothetical protein FRX31_031651 [Thalictrum thalictroides]